MSLTDICKGHKWIVVQNYPYYMPFNLLIESINSLAGLKAGILCSGTHRQVRSATPPPPSSVLGA